MWVKVCGLTSVENALAVCACGVEAIGLNFYARSPRRISVETAADIVRALPAQAEPIGLFVNHSLAEIREVVERTGIRIIQLHGDESPAFAAELQRTLPQAHLIRAVRLHESNRAEVLAELAAYRAAGVRLLAVIVDARVEGNYGGTGETAPWELIADLDREELPPLILAGGLTPANVRTAVQQVQPWGVDTASGVEASPGVKDLELVRQFVEQACGSATTRHNLQ